MTCKMLIEQMHNNMWQCFWLSIAVHLFLGFFIPIMREFVRNFRAEWSQVHDGVGRGLKDHEDLAKIILRNKNTPEI